MSYWKILRYTKNRDRGGTNVLGTIDIHQVSNILRKHCFGVEGKQRSQNLVWEDGDA